MEDIKKTQTVDFPHFIQNKPCGDDKFDGKSQKRLANTISKHILRNDSLDNNHILPRIIGLEGNWGSGKTNVVKMIEEKLSKSYYFFEYDAWGHQEDLQRRSILEILTGDLIDKKILIGDTTIKIKGGGTKKVSWSDKLKYLLARKTETITEKYPLISHGMVSAFLVGVLTPISTFIAYVYKSTLNELCSILIAFLPVLISLIVWLIAYLKNNKYGLSYLLAIYQDKVENDVCYETLSEDEPTVREFKSWMQDISDFLKKKNQFKLVIVFDNMDRLPSDKVKELWSSIHTFFAGEGFESVWTIIPFDEKHLACAFGDENNENTKQLTRYFINKTFPIVYRVAPPVITDYRNIFETLFTEAFGHSLDKFQEVINRIYRLVNPNANMRDMITFINEMVALRQEWGNDISLINIAVFCLRKSTILENPVEQILSGDYLKGFQAIVNNNMLVQNEMAALVYGVDVEHAKQIPLKKYIEGCIHGEVNHDINRFAESNKQFDVVLDEVIKNSDISLIDKMIHCLNGMTRQNSLLIQIWIRLADIKLREKLNKQEFTTEYQELLVHLDEKSQNDVINKLYLKIANFQNFNGSDYFNALYAINNFITQNQISCDLTSFVEEKNVEPSVFVDYIRTANNQVANNEQITFKTYKLCVNPESLDTYLASHLPDNYDYDDIIETLKEDSKYKFPNLLQAITKCIVEKDLTIENVGTVFATYRYLISIEDGPMPIKIDSTTVNQLYTQFINNKQNTLGYYDLIAMQLMYGNNVSLKEACDIKYVAELMDYYVDYGEMLIKCTNLNNRLLNMTLQYMVNNNLGRRLSLSQILPKYSEIRDRINVTDEVFVEHLSKWGASLETELTEDNIQTIIPQATFYEITSRISNSLTDHINKIAIKTLSTQTTESLHNQIINQTLTYWINVLKSLLCKIDSLPDNLTELGKKVMVNIASGQQYTSNLPGYLNVLIVKLDNRKIKTTIRDIRNDLCNAKYNINVNKFKYLEELLRLNGSLLDRAGDVVDKVIKPIITDVSCREIILQNSEFYIGLIKNAADDAHELIMRLREISKSDTTPEMIEFLKAVDKESQLDAL